jgi:hypothetical protein
VAGQSQNGDRRQTWRQEAILGSSQLARENNTAQHSTAQHSSDEQASQPQGPNAFPNGGTALGNRRRASCGGEVLIVVNTRVESAAAAEVRRLRWCLESSKNEAPDEREWVCGVRGAKNSPHWVTGLARLLPR